MKPARAFALAALSALLLLHAISAPRGAHGRAAAAVGDYVVYLPMMRSASAPATPTPQPDGASPEEREVVRLTNVARAANGCAALTIAPALTNAARGHSQDMASKNFFSHTGSDGSQFFERMRDAGYGDFGAAAENIAAGQRTPAQVLDSWLGSAGHRQNILNCDFREIGVGFASSPDSNFGSYWTQVFAAPLD